MEILEPESGGHVSCVWISILVEYVPGNVEMSVYRCQHQRCPIIICLEVHNSTAPNQQQADIRMSMSRRHEQRSPLIVLTSIHNCAVLDQQLHDVLMSISGRREKRSTTIG